MRSEIYLRSEKYHEEEHNCKGDDYEKIIFVRITS